MAQGDSTTSATEFIDVTTAANFIPEFWSKEILIVREDELVFVPLVNRSFEKELTLGDTLHVNSVSDLSVRSKTANTAITYETVEEAQTDITVSTHKYVALAVESIAKVQTDRDQLQLYAGKMGEALAKDLDDFVAALIDGLDNSVGSLAVELTDDDFLRSIQYLDDANVPQSERNIVLSPAQAVSLLKRDRFVHNDYDQLRGSIQTSAAQTAYVKSFLGMPMYKSVNVDGTNAAGHDCVMMHREALALVVQMEPTPHAMFDIDYFADKVAIEQLYGGREMRGDHGVWMKGG